MCQQGIAAGPHDCLRYVPNALIEPVAPPLPTLANAATALVEPDETPRPARIPHNPAPTPQK